jgi:hypothetical protein
MSVATENARKSVPQKSCVASDATTQNIFTKGLEATYETRYLFTVLYSFDHLALGILQDNANVVACDVCR